MTVPNEQNPTRVGIGLVRRGDCYLIRQRLEGQAMAGRWEFPGGKCEIGETPEQATARECLEEIGVAVVVGGLVRRVLYRYPHAFVELFSFDCSIVDPAAEPGADTGFRWVEAGSLPNYQFPEANDSLIATLSRSGGDPGTFRPPPA